MITGDIQNLYYATCEIADAMSHISDCIPKVSAVDFDKTDLSLIGVVGQLNDMKSFIDRLYQSAKGATPTAK